MEILKQEHENIRTLASRELFKFGIKMKLKKLPPSKKCAPKKRSYGVALTQLKKVDVHIGRNTAVIPVGKVYNDMVNFIILREGLHEEGIFRVEGPKSKARTLVKILNSGYQIPESMPVIVVCMVLKIYLRQIPDHLISRNLMPWFLAAAKLQEADSEQALSLCVLLLPLENLYLLVFLMQFFKEVATCASRNKMTSYNLAVVIAPNVFPSLPVHELQAQRDFSDITLSIIKSFIEHSETLGVVPPALLNRLDELHQENATACKYGFFGRYVSA